MAFSASMTNLVQSIGNLALATGPYASTSGSTGGEITTGFGTVVAMWLQPESSSVIATQSVVNETLPLSNSSVTIVTSSNESGQWFALGY